MNIGTSFACPSFGWDAFHPRLEAGDFNAATLNQTDQIPSLALGRGLHPDK
jgi:hypothetical protein